MAAETHSVLEFEAFRLDQRGQYLARDGEPISLRPKTWDVLCYLFDHRGALVTKGELLDAVWRELTVSEDTLSQSIRELRLALGDDPRKPRFIETVHGRGFRFIAAVRTYEAAGPRNAGEPEGPVPEIVGREAELNILRRALEQARRGSRQLVFVTGEAGIGKTALVEALLGAPELRAGDVVVASGQCFEQYGTREAYMPVLEALERLLPSAAGAEFLPVFRRFAPTWLAQMPRLLNDDHQRPRAASFLAPAPMLREVATALDAMSARITIVLVLEDLHWSDPSTIDLLSMLALRREPARLLILGTYRPADAAVQEHPIRELRQTLRSRKCVVEVALGYLDEAAVRTYLHRRFGLDSLPLTRLIHEHTDGSPLFIGAVLEDLLRREWIRQDPAGGWELHLPPRTTHLPLPEDLREAVVLQLRRLTREEQETLEVASVSGGYFAPQAVAAILARAATEVETICQRLAESRRFLNGAGAVQWPDGSMARRFCFAHVVYLRAIYETLPEGRRQSLHQKLGEVLEAAYDEHSDEIASELVPHFERSGDRKRAVRYLARSASRLLTRTAAREAIASLERGLQLLAELPDSAEQHRQELELRSLMVLALSVAYGYVAPGMRPHLERSREICEALGDRSLLFGALYPLWWASLGASDREQTVALVARLSGLAAEIGTRQARAEAILARGMTELWRGHFSVATTLLGPLADAEEPLHPPLAYAVDPGVSALAFGGTGLWCLGRPAEARHRIARALARARASGSPLSVVDALIHSAHIAIQCGAAGDARQHGQEAVALCTDKGLSWYMPLAEMLDAAARARFGEAESAVMEMERSLAAYRATDTRIALSMLFSLFAEVAILAQRWDIGRRSVEEGIELAETDLDECFLAELWRLRGEISLAEAIATRRRAASRRSVAGECYRKALAIAGRGEARSFELRAAMSLMVLEEDPDGEARDRLRQVYDCFREGSDSRDLLRAAALLGD